MRSCMLVRVCGMQNLLIAVHTYRLYYVSSYYWMHDVIMEGMCLKYSYLREELVKGCLGRNAIRGRGDRESQAKRAVRQMQTS